MDNIKNNENYINYINRVYFNSKNIIKIDKSVSINEYIMDNIKEINKHKNFTAKEIRYRQVFSKLISKVSYLNKILYKKYKIIYEFIYKLYIENKIVEFNIYYKIFYKYMLGSIQSAKYIEKLKNELIEKEKEIEDLKKENVILRKLLEKYNIVDEVVNNLDIAEVSKKDNKRNSVYYDTKEEIINENDKTCLKCDEKTILGNIYCIKHKMEMKNNSNNKNISKDKILNNVEKVNTNNISEEKDRSNIDKLKIL